MRNFGTANHPLRVSQLPYLVLCTWRAVALELGITTREPSGKAADTGTAAHLGIATWHLNGKKLADAVAAMRAASAGFPLADLDEAERFVTRYTDDPRNQEAEVVAVEQKVEVEIDPRFTSGPPIVIQGTCDQIRRVGGRLQVWDVKTGNRDALYFQNRHALQLAAYTLAVSRMYVETVDPGGYVRIKGYFTRGASLPSPDGVFVPADIADPDALLDAVRWAVCAIREGYYVPTPGEHCADCPLTSNSFCVPMLARQKAA